MKTMQIYILLFFLFSAFVNAQDPVFMASLSKNPVTQGETFQVTFTLNNIGQNFRAPSFPGFKILSGPNQSSGTQVINGKISRSSSFSFILSAEKIGTYTIKPATIKLDGKTVSSNALKIEVVEPSEAEKKRRQQQQQEEEQMQDQANQIIRDNLYIKATVSKSNIYRGEQIIATYKLFVNSELNVIDLQVSKNPSFNGFWSDDIEQSQVNWVRELVNGVPFRVAEIKKVILSPQQTGKLTVDPFEFESVVRLQTGSQRRRSIFDDFFGRGSYKDFEYLVKSNPISVNVKNFPENAPSSFNGAVGDLNMEAWLDKTETSTDEPVTLKIKISGNGNIKLINPLDLNLPPDLETFEPKTADNTSSNASGVSGNKIFEYLIIPRASGKFKIPAIEFSYFDPASSSYKLIKSEEFTLNVAKGSSDGSASSVTGFKKEDLQFIGKDIRYIATKTELYQRSEKSFFKSQIYFLMLGLPFIFLIILIIFRRKKEEDNKNTALVKNKRATKLAQKRLSKAEKLLKSGQDDSFYEEIINALWGYISDKLNISTADLNKDRVKEELNKIKLKEETISRFIEILNESEFARYSNAARDNGKPNQMFDKSKDIISQIEKEIRA